MSIRFPETPKLLMLLHASKQEQWLEKMSKYLSAPCILLLVLPSGMAVSIAITCRSQIDPT